MFSTFAADLRGDLRTAGREGVMGGGLGVSAAVADVEAETGSKGDFEVEVEATVVGGRSDVEDITRLGPSGFGFEDDATRRV